MCPSSLGTADANPIALRKIVFQVVPGKVDPVMVRKMFLKSETGPNSTGMLTTRMPPGRKRRKMSRSTKGKLPTGVTVL